MIDTGQTLNPKETSVLGTVKERMFKGGHVNLTVQTGPGFLLNFDFSLDSLPPATGQRIRLALRSSADATGTWYSERRNVREDFKALHGTDIRYIDAVALMTDTDNGAGRATSYYGDIFFSSE